MRRFFCIPLVLTLLLLLLFSCQKKEKTTLFTGHQMTMPYRLVISGALSPEKKKKVQNIIETCFSETDRIYNKWNPSSELSLFNTLKQGESMPVSFALERMLLRTEEFVELSGGRFDPTIEPLQQLWKHKLEQGQLPNTEETAPLLDVVGWNQIHFGDGTLRKDHDNTALDLGGIAKGFCVDEIVQNLNKAGFSDVYFEWGGEIRTSGQHPDNRSWTVFVSRFGDPDPQHALATIPLENQAIATSGDYLQCWKVRGSQNTTITYFHIINPLTKQPMQSTDQSIASATVIAPDCATADALATAAMVFDSAPEARQWAQHVQSKIPSTTFWIVSREEVE